MTPETVKADYDRMMDEVGETVTVRRYSGTGDSRTSQDYPVRARVTGFEPRELVGDIKQGDRKIIMLADDLLDRGFTVPPRIGDKVVVRGRELNIEAVDDNTRRLAGVAVAYDLRVRG